METEIRIGEAVITLSIIEDGSLAPEFSGEVSAEFDSMAQSALEGWTRTFQNRAMAEWTEPLDVSSVADADSFISVICALGEIGGEYRVSWQGSCGFWAFHDIAHARNDFSACAEDRTVYFPAEPISERTEVAAHVDALRAYLACAGNAEQAVRELLALGPAHAERFGS